MQRSLRSSASRRAVSTPSKSLKPSQWNLKRHTPRGWLIVWAKTGTSLFGRISRRIFGASLTVAMILLRSSTELILTQQYQGVGSRWIHTVQMQLSQSIRSTHGTSTTFLRRVAGCRAYWSTSMRRFPVSWSHGCTSACCTVRSAGMSRITCFTASTICTGEIPSVGMVSRHSLLQSLRPPSRHGSLSALQSSQTSFSTW
mmetsp:Transcript_14372/g.34039  ORF Transcript_14372/g.34039 Transcript_14372/m.34039 type:complete len:200 (+) Transcript_14372:1317-1916(+)